MATSSKLSSHDSDECVATVSQPVVTTWRVGRVVMVMAPGLTPRCNGHIMVAGEDEAVLQRSEAKWLGFNPMFSVRAARQLVGKGGIYFCSCELSFRIMVLH